MNASGWRAKEEAERYDRAIRCLLRDKLGYIADHRMETADVFSDCSLAMDYKLTIKGVDGGSLAARIRYRNRCRYRQLTIRSQLPSGARTELDKVRAGCTQWYVYAWVDPGVYDVLPEWMILAMDPLRASGLLDDDRPMRRNDDGTRFVVYGRQELVDCGAAVAGEIDWQAAAKAGVCQTCGGAADGNDLRPARWRAQKVRACSPCWMALSA